MGAVFSPRGEDGRPKQLLDRATGRIDPSVARYWEAHYDIVRTLRDHWATLSTLAFFGGGLKTGQVIGKSARNNDVPASDPISTPNLLATVMHYLFDAVALRITRGLPTIVANAASAKLIEALF